MYQKVIEVIKDRKKELKVSSSWLAEESDVSEQTVKRMLSSESPETLFCNVCKVANALDLSLGDLDPNAAEEFGGKRVKEVLADYKNISKKHDELKAENDSLKAKSADLNTEITLLKAELDRLRLTLEHKEEIIALHNYYNKLKSNN